MTSLKVRIGQLEQAPVLRGSLDLQESIGMTAQQNLAAIKARCHRLLEVTDNPSQREGLLATIAEIDEGKFQLPAPLPREMDARAKEMHRLMVEQFD